MKIINKTPHPIVVRNEKGETIYSPEGEVARLQTETRVVSELDGFEVEEAVVIGNNLPEPQEGVVLIVSGMVLSALKGVRSDLVAPNTNKAVRNEKGHIVSVPGFVR